MTLLWVGDPHAEVQDLDDVRALCGLVEEVARKNAATVVMAGDLYHHHAVVRAEVQEHWYRFFELLHDHGLPAIVLKGNHDMPTSDGSTATPLLAHENHACVVHSGPYVRDFMLFCPYTAPAQLVEWSQKYPGCRALFCHQTFSGATYENGMYAPDGVDLELIAQEQVVSGHIHTPQSFGKIWYPGAPRWRTKADANIDRAIWLLETSHGRITNKTPIPTDTVCRKVFHFVDTPDAPAPTDHEDRRRYFVDSKGPADWLETRKAVFSGWARWRPVRTDTVSVKVRESDGVSVAWKKWTEAFKPRFGTPQETLAEMARSRLGGIA